MKAVEIENLSIERESFSLKIKKLTIEEGQKVAILGENGSGKTTLLLAIAGFIESNIRVFSKDISNLKPIDKASILSFLPQFSDFSLNSTAFKVVLLGRYHIKNGLFDEEDLKNTEEILEKLKMKHLARKQFKALSGGQKRLILIAKTINQDSKVMVFDEPLSSVDIKYSKIVAEYLKSLRKTIISSVHDINLALAYFDRVIILKDGRIIFDDSPNKITKEVIDEAYEINSISCSNRFIFF
ncbi:ABC transporter ATP-binding protein [Hippea alviniae]|uniref:ABC transporter ATP-binding protein n=1 Tax=Hippea alviniae TaxID=1279027 RepID=UPI0003B3D073|nr:ABC transporter ATP-binding protein [Hippea alviniae]